MNELEFKINEYITLKLENGKTDIYVKKRLFRQCKYLILNIPVENIVSYDKIRSIDDIKGLDNSMEYKGRDYFCIPPETEFQAHCSNIQVWAENDYDTCLLHSNLAFPLLRRLTNVGDPQAKKIFKEEIAIRFLEGKINLKIYLAEEKYLDYLNKEEMESLIEEYLNSLKKIEYSEEKDKEIKCVIEVGLKYLKERIIGKIIKKNKDFYNCREGISNIFFQLATSYIYKHEYYKAMELFKIRSEYNVGIEEYRIRLRDLYNIRTQLEIDPNNVIVLNQLGKVFCDMNYCDRAILTFKEAIEVEKFHFPSWRNFIETNIKWKHYWIEIENIMEILKLHPNKPKIIENITSICLDHINIEKIKRFEYLRQLKKNKPWLEQNYYTCLLPRNLSFILLRSFTAIRKPNAETIFQEEINKRFLKGNISVLEYLVQKNYIEYLNEKELFYIFEEYIRLLKASNNNKNETIKVKFLIKRYKKAHRINISNIIDFLDILGGIYYELIKFNKSHKMYNTNISLNTKDDSFLFKLEFNSHKKRLLEKAIKASLEAYRIKLEDISRLDNLIKIYYKKGEYKFKDFFFYRRILFIPKFKRLSKDYPKPSKKRHRLFKPAYYKPRKPPKIR